MRAARWKLAVVGLIALLAATGLPAWYMEFKLLYPLHGPGTNGSNSGLQTIALPFNQQTGLVNASDLLADINDTAAAPVTVSVQRFLKQSDELVAYGGGPLDLNVDFTLGPGEGYRVQVNSDVNYVIIGSHDPAFQVNFDGPGTNGSNSGLNLYAYVYHSVASTASELLAEINGQSVSGNAVVSIQRFLRTSDELVAYAGGPLDIAADFVLIPGEAYRVQVRSDVQYLPGHY